MGEEATMVTGEESWERHENSDWQLARVFWPFYYIAAAQVFYICRTWCFLFDNFFVAKFTSKCRVVAIRPIFFAPNDLCCKIEQLLKYKRWATLLCAVDRKVSFVFS